MGIDRRQDTAVLQGHHRWALRGSADRFGRDEDGAGLDWQGGGRIGTGGAGEEDNDGGQDSVTSVVGQDLSA